MRHPTPAAHARSPPADPAAGATEWVLDGRRINRLPEGLPALVPQLRRLSFRGHRSDVDLGAQRAVSAAH